MNKIAMRGLEFGQGITKDIVIVALIAVAASVYQAFGSIVLGQAAAAASALAGNKTGARATVDGQSTKADGEGTKAKTLKTFEN